MFEKDEHRVICLCQGIPYKKMIVAIEKGCHTVIQVNQKVGSGRGSCRGKRCRPVIRQLINDHLLK